MFFSCPRDNYRIPPRRLKATTPGDMLQRILFSARVSQDGTQEINPFVSPFASIVKRRWFQALLCALSIYLLYNSCVTIAGLSEYGTIRARHFRFRLADGAGAADGGFQSAVNVTGCLLRRGCPLDSGCVRWEHFPGTTSSPPPLVLPSAAAVDGFSVETAYAAAEAEVAARAAAPRASLLLEASPDGLTYGPAAALRFRRTQGGIRVLGGAAQLPPGGLTADLRAPWPLLLHTGLRTLLLALCCAGAAAGGVLRRPAAARAVAVWCCAYIAAVDALAGVGFAAAREAGEAFYPLALGVAFGIMAATLAAMEALVADALLTLGCLALSARMVQVLPPPHSPAPIVTNCFCICYYYYY